MTITSCCLANSLVTRRCWHPRLLLQHCSYYKTFRSSCSKLRNRPDSRCTSTFARTALQKPAAALDMSRNVNNGSAYLQASQCYCSYCHSSTTMSIYAVLRFWVADWILQNLHRPCCFSLIIKGSHLVLACPGAVLSLLTLTMALPFSRYLFNAGEGFQRYCVQHKLKLSRMMNILATRAAVDAIGGIPGASLLFNVVCWPFASERLPTLYMAFSADHAVMSYRYGTDHGRFISVPAC